MFDSYCHFHTGSGASFDTFTLTNNVEIVDEVGEELTPPQLAEAKRIGFISDGQGQWVLNSTIKEGSFHVANAIMRRT